MSPGKLLKAAFAALLALTTLGLGIACLRALQTGSASLPVGGTIEMAAGYDRRATALLDDPGRGASDVEQADTLSERALAQYPYDIGAILRQAQIETLRGGRLTGRAAERLARSYDLVAIDPSLATWRIPFCLAHWGELAPELRKAVRQEFMTVARDKAYLRTIRREVDGLAPGQGRLTVEIWASRLRRSPNT